MPSNLARESLICMCFGPVASAVRKGRLTSVSGAADSSIFGFMLEAEFRFYDALTRIARGAPAEGAEAWRKTLDEHLAKLSLWATQCPANFAHRDLLARAEGEGAREKAASITNTHLLVALSQDTVGPVAQVLKSTGLTSTIVRAAQAISSEMVLDKVIEQLMQ